MKTYKAVVVGIVGVALVVLLAGWCVVMWSWLVPHGGVTGEPLPARSGAEIYGATPRDTVYVIDGRQVKLHNGMAEEEMVPGSASKVVTRYFGNEVNADLDGDGREDVMFLLTQQTGGSGTFFYVVAALNTSKGYIGSQAYFLGDRIAPQTTEMSNNPRHKNVIVVNYADRAPGEPMTAQPSIGKSVWIKLDPLTMQFGEVVQNFEGESK